VRSDTFPRVEFFYGETHAQQGKGGANFTNIGGMKRGKVDKVGGTVMGRGGSAELTLRAKAQYIK